MKTKFLNSGYQRKTDRPPYGAHQEAIMEAAKAGQFTWRDVRGPWTTKQKSARLHDLARDGRLRVIRVGRGGRFGSQPAIYQFLRPMQPRYKKKGSSYA